MSKCKQLFEGIDPNQNMEYLDRRFAAVAVNANKALTNTQTPPLRVPVTNTENRESSQESTPTQKGKVLTTEATKRGILVVRPGVVFDIGNEKPAFLFAHPNPTSEHIVKQGIFEQPLIQWSKQFVDQKLDFIDIGAHSGTYALSLAPYCRNAYAFEAQRMTYFQLCGGIAINHYENVHPHHCALGDSNNGTVTLNITSADGGGTTINPNIPKLQNQPVIRTETTIMKTLDSFGLFPQKGEKKRIGLIKIDCEGSELAVLKGAQETIQKNGKPPLLFETWVDAWFAADKKVLFDYISNTLGYKVIKAAPNTNNMFIATN